jgi:glutathione peroxidase
MIIKMKKLVLNLIVGTLLVGVLPSCGQENKTPMQQNTEKPSMNDKTIHNLTYEPLQGGNPVSFKEYAGKKILLVNVASKCGYTPQYAQLEELYQEYKDKLVIIGVPSNQFGGQEPGTAEEIAEFCKLNYGVTFPLAKKQEVKGAGKSDIYQFLTEKDRNGLDNYNVQWNFNKFLLNEQGVLIGYYPSGVEPLSEEILKEI